MKRLSYERMLAGLLLVIWGLIVVHAPLSVFIGSRVPEIALGVKAWKEILMAVAAILLAVVVTRRHAWELIWRDKLMWAIAGYAALHVALIGIFPLPLTSWSAGLMIDLRYLFLFVLVYVFLRLYPRHWRRFVAVGIAGAAIVIGFAVVQLVLPRDILATIGYGPTTIEPYLTVDKNPDYVRFNSTLRGPNSLGAYAVIVLAGVLAYRKRLPRASGWQVTLAGSTLVALWVSYSRSALIAAMLAAGIVALGRWGGYFKRPLVLGTLVLGTLALAVLGIGLRDTAVIQNVVLHDNPTTGAQVDSNTAHANSLVDGTRRMLVQPLGAGVGSTGSASLFGDAPMIIENQYLMIVHEAGWAGLALFMVIFGGIMIRLFRRRQDWLALAAFASGTGLAVIGLLLPVWADDTVAIVWWGLAGIALANGEVV